MIVILSLTKNQTPIRTVTVMVVYCIFSIWFCVFRHSNLASYFINLVGIVVCFAEMFVQTMWTTLKFIGMVIIIINIVWFAFLYDFLKYLVIFLVAGNSSEIWSGLLVDTDNCRSGLLWPLDQFLWELSLYKVFNYCCLVGGFLLGYPTSTWLSRFTSLAHWVFSLMSNVGQYYHGRVQDY